MISFAFTVAVFGSFDQISSSGVGGEARDENYIFNLLLYCVGVVRSSNLGGALRDPDVLTG